MNCDQLAIRFNCHGSGMVGIIDLPERPLPRGVLVVAGQPYSRLGAQRRGGSQAARIFQRVKVKRARLEQAAAIALGAQ